MKKITAKTMTDQLQTLICEIYRNSHAYDDDLAETWEQVEEAAKQVKASLDQFIKEGRK